MEMAPVPIPVHSEVTDFLPLPLKTGEGSLRQDGPSPGLSRQLDKGETGDKGLN